jgi:hypothetical protein
MNQRHQPSEYLPTQRVIRFFWSVMTSRRATQLRSGHGTASIGVNSSDVPRSRSERFTRSDAESLSAVSRTHHRPPRSYYRCVKPRWPRLVALGGVGVVASQAGHLLAYGLLYRSSAQSVQSSGAHTYFPLLAKTSVGVAAVAILAALLIISVCRLVALRPGSKVTRSPSFFSLLAALFTIQVTFFVVQETIESNLAGTYTPTALYLFLIGMFGQLPIAALAAIALKWLWARLEIALSALRNVVAVRAIAHGTIAAILTFPAQVYQPALAETCPAAYVKRGPPPTLRG